MTDDEAELRIRDIDRSGEFFMVISDAGFSSEERSRIEVLEKEFRG
jgi:hypothetical protein